MTSGPQELELFPLLAVLPEPNSVRGLKDYFA